MKLTSITLKVNGADILASVTGTLTSGMVGIPVTIQYDDSWEGLTKNLVCRCCRGADSAEHRTILNVGNTAVVAHEVMKAGMILYLGVEGYSTDGKLVIPTTWAMCGVIQTGANTGEDLSADPTLPVWGQLQTEIEQIRQDAVTPEQITGILSDIQAAVQASAIYADRAETAAKQAEEAASSIQQPENLVLKSPDGTAWNIAVDNLGNVGAVKVTGSNSGEQEPSNPNTPENEDMDYHVMTIEDASETITAQGKTLIRGYDNSERSNVLVPNTLNDLPVWINSAYPGTNNFNVSGNIENLTFEENSTVTGVLELQGDSLKTIKNFPATMTGLITGSYKPYTANLESVGGLEKNTALTSLNLGFSASLKQPPVLNANAPITSLSAAFSNCKGMVYDISSWRIPSRVTNIRQLFRSCGGITGNFLVDRNYTADNCLYALYETSVRGVTVTDADFAAPFQLFEEKLTDYTPLNSEAALGSTKQWKFHVPRVSAAYRAFREAYAGTVNGIMKYELAVTDGDAPTKNITFYGDSQLSPFGNVTSQMLPGMSDEVFLWNLAVRGATTESYKPVFAKFPERRSDVTVLWLMTNDTGIGADATMSNIRHYVDSLDTDKYIILGTWFFHYEELKARNEQLRTTYGSHYFDVHQYTLDNWERITGITPTEADLAAVANDTVPPSLIHSDGVHENDAGGLVIATGIKEKLLELGYIDESWLAAE